MPLLSLRLQKNKFSRLLRAVFVCVAMVCAWGAWGRTYLWSLRDTTQTEQGAWNSKDNWRVGRTDGGSITEWVPTSTSWLTIGNANNSYPGDTNNLDDTVYINTTASYTQGDIFIKLTGNLANTIDRLYLETDGDHTIYLDLQGNTLSVKDFFVGCREDIAIKNNAKTDLPYYNDGTAKQQAVNLVVLDSVGNGSLSLTSFHIVNTASATLTANGCVITAGAIDYTNTTDSTLKLNDADLTITGWSQSDTGTLTITSDEGNTGTLHALYKNGTELASYISQQGFKIDSSKITDLDPDGNDVTTYTWNSGFYYGSRNKDWTDSRNWTPCTGAPVNAADTAIFAGDKEGETAEVVFDWTAPLTIKNLRLATEDEKTITLNTNGKTLSVSGTLLVKTANTIGSGQVTSSNIALTGAGTIEAYGFDFPASGSHRLSIDSETTLRVTDIYYGNATNANTMQFSGGGTLEIPASGAFLYGGTHGIVYDGITPAAYGEPTYYQADYEESETAFFDGGTITLSLTAKSVAGSTGGFTEKFPCTITTVGTDAPDLSHYSFNGTTGLSGASFSTTVSCTVSAGNNQSQTVQVEIALSGSPAFTSGQGFHLTVKSPDGVFNLLDGNFLKIDNIWTGTSSTSWNAKENWQADIVPTAGKLKIPAGCPQYPVLTESDSPAGTTKFTEVTIEANASLTLSGGSFDADTITSGGTITVTDGELTASDALTLTGNIENNGSVQAGTVVIEAGASVACRGTGTVIVLGDWTTESGASFTAHDGTVRFTGDNATVRGTNTFATAEFSGADATLADDTTFTTATFSGSGATLDGNNTFGTATFSADATINGDNTFADFICTTAGVTLTFAAGTTQSVTNALTINGQAADTKITLSGAGSGAWTMDVPVDAATVSYARVQNGTSAQDSIVAQYSEDGGGNTWWLFSYTWTGGAGTGDWITAANWAENAVPDTASAVTIPAVASAVYPTIASAHTVRRLTIGEDATLTFSSATAALTVSDTATGAFTNNGTVITDGTGTLVLSGTAAEHGTWEYTGGTLSAIAHLSFNKLILHGPLSVAADYEIMAAEGITIDTAASDTIRGLGAFSFRSPVVITRSATITTALGADGAIHFYDTIDGESIDTATLSITGGYVHLHKAVGTQAALQSFTCTVQGTQGENLLVLYGTSVTTTGNQRYAGDVGLYGTDEQATSAGDSVLTALTGTITFEKDVFNDGRSGAESHALTVNAAQSVTFSGSVGTAHGNRLSALSVTAEAITLSDAVKTAGAMTFTGAVTNNGTITVPALSDGTTAVLFDGAYNGTEGALVGARTSATDSAPNPTIAFAGAVTFGTFTAHDDVVLLNGTAAQTLTTHAQTYADIRFANAAGITVTDDLTVTGTLFNTAALSFAKNDVSVSFGAYEGASDGTDALTMLSGMLTATGAGGTLGTLQTAGDATLTNTGSGGLTLLAYKNSGATALALDGGTAGIAFSAAAYDGVSLTTDGTVLLAPGAETNAVGTLTVQSGATAISGALFSDALAIAGGTLTLGGDSAVASVLVADGTSLIAGANETNAHTLTVAGDWTNNAGTDGFIARAGTVRFTGDNATVRGTNVFATAEFSGANATLNGDNTFSTATFSGDGATLNGNSIFDTATFTGTNATLNGDNAFTTATFNGDSATLDGSNTFGTATFSADTNINGDNTYTRFVCTTAGTTLIFAAGTTQTVDGTLYIAGTENNRITLQSDTLGATWQIKTPVDTAEVSYVVVTDSVSVYDSIVAYFSVNGGNNTYWNFLEGMPLPPLALTLAPLGERHIYAIFAEKIAFNHVTIDQMTSAQRAEALNFVPDNVLFVRAGENPIGNPSGIKTDWQVERATYLAGGKDYTVLVLHLNQRVSLSDIETTALYIERMERPDMPHYHPLSDFALNAVNPLYAYAEGTWGDTAIFGSQTLSVRDFSADSGERLRTDTDILVQAQLVAQNGERAVLIPDVAANISQTSRSDVLNDQLGTDWRVWLPTAVSALASSANTNTLTQTPGEPVADDGVLWNFTLQNETNDDDTHGWKSGDEIQFVFKITDANGDDMLLDSDGDGTGDFPLYALWMPQPNPSALPFVDVWSFKLHGTTAQRGSVTILNNVINVSIKEQTVIEVNMPEAGNLSVYVMTLDGNIVQRLEHGRIEAGLHRYTWNGTNRAGNAVARGLYFVRVVGNGIDETRKVMCVK